MPIKPPINLGTWFIPWLVGVPKYIWEFFFPYLRILRDPQDTAILQKRQINLAEQLFTYDCFCLINIHIMA